MQESVDRVDGSNDEQDFNADAPGPKDDAGSDVSESVMS
jgi:hypothetical protein